VWSEQQKLISYNDPFGVRFGAAVSMTDALVVVGAPQDYGTAYVFEATEPYATGSYCNVHAACASGFCVDGVCCESACDGICQTCADSPGTCTLVLQNNGDDTCSDVCDGAGACKKFMGSMCALGEECVSGFCTEGVCCETACTGLCETCAKSVPVGVCTVLPQGAASRDAMCFPFVCTGVSDCPSLCLSDDNCDNSHYCEADGTCQPRTAVGVKCEVTGERDCATAHSCRSCNGGQCVDGYCCFSTCEGACERCNGGDLGWPGTANGTCATAPEGVFLDEACETERTQPDTPPEAANSVDPTSSSCACRLGISTPTHGDIAGLLFLAAAACGRRSVVRRQKRSHAASTTG
jgi:hypothetical protein